MILKRFAQNYLFSRIKLSHKLCSQLNTILLFYEKRFHCIQISLPLPLYSNISPTHTIRYHSHIQIPLTHLDTSPKFSTSLTFRYLSHFDVIGCILLGSFATLAIFFATTTFYYRKKARTLQYGGEVFKVQ